MLIFSLVFLYFVTSSNSLYYTFPNAYCYPVNSDLSCTSTAACETLCSEIGACCGFYHSVDSSTSYSMCDCSDDLRIYEPNVAFSQAIRFEMQLLAANLDSLSCDQLRQGSVCNSHSDCEWDGSTCMNETDEGTSYTVLGIVFLSFCACSAMFAGFYLYNRKLRRLTDVESLPQSPKRPVYYESPKGDDGPGVIEGEPGFVFHPEGEGKRAPHHNQGESHSVHSRYDIDTPRTPHGGGEHIPGEHRWNEEATAIAMPAQSGESFMHENDQDVPEPGENGLIEREHRESLVYRL